MRGRYLAIAAAVWAAGYAGIYILVVHWQGDSPAGWYVALLGAGIVLLAVSTVGRCPRPMLICAMVLLALAALAGLPSIGILLVPGVAGAAVAAAGSAWRSPSRNPMS